jgi:hypothetical protein
MMQNLKQPHRKTSTLGKLRGSLVNNSPKIFNQNGDNLLGQIPFNCLPT